MKRVIWLVLLLVGCGGGEAVSPHVAEQTDYFDGVAYHRYYRYTGAKLGYATSLDGVHFDPYPGNPIMEDSHFPYQVEYEGRRYLLVQHRRSAFYLYDVTVPAEPKVVNGGRAVLEGDFFNVGVAVVGSRWHMLVEGKSGEVFHLRYTWADFPDLDFNENLGPVVFGDSGNPYLTYIPERGVILALFGGDYSSTGHWRIRAGVWDGSWKSLGFAMSDGGHLADPDLGVGVESGLMTCGINQDSVSTYRYDGGKVGLYDSILGGHVEFESLGVTMRP